MNAALEALRRIADDTGKASPEMAGYLERVRTRAYSVTDAEVEALKAAGISEDEIFEQTVAVALAEGLRRLDAGLAVLER